MREGGLPIGARIGAGAAVSGVLLGLLVWRADVGDVVDKLGGASVPGILAVVTLHMAALVVRVRRWRWLLDAAGASPPPDAHRWLVWDSVFFGWLGNLVLPARVGELARPGMYARGSGHPFPIVLATSVVERAADMAVVAGLCWFALGVLPTPDGIPSELRVGARWGGILALVGLVVLAVLARRSPEQPDGQVGGFIVRFREGLRPLRDPAASAIVLASTVVIWTLEAACVWLTFVAFGFEPSWSAAICHVVAVTLSIAVVTVPAGLGVEQAVTVAVFAPWGIVLEDALAMSVVLTAAAVVCIVPFGLVALVRQGGPAGPATRGPPA